jgi:hypothetical protein
MDTTPAPSLEETLKYNQAKAILQAPCVVVDQLYECVKTITEYEERFNIPEEERCTSNYITKSTKLKLNSQNSEDNSTILLEPLCSVQPKFTPIVVEMVPETNEHVDFIKGNEFVQDPLNKKCYGFVPFFRLGERVWKYFQGMGDGYIAKYINDNGDVEKFDFNDDGFRNSVVPVIPSQWSELEGYKLAN